MRAMKWSHPIFACISAIALMLAAPLFLSAQSRASEMTRADVLARMQPYTGPSVKGVNTATMTGKVLCGYQGWFSTEGDGSETGWRHYSRQNRFEPGMCSIDFWPDMRELDTDERYATPFQHTDGSTATVFSSYNQKTVVRHFQWMRDYSIDGVFVQRFANPIGKSDLLYNRVNAVLSHCRAGANQYGRVYAVMYDLSGMSENSMQVVMDDWKNLIDRMRITKDAAYLHHNGKPVVAVWGIGFGDGRKYTLQECATLLDFLKSDPTYGGNTVMIGVPSGWRTLTRDSVDDPNLHEVIRKADIISPWTVGRYGNPSKVTEYAEKYWQPDIAWCRQQGKEYLPVVFPGFSWSNLKPGRALNQIPRLQGRFLWKQYAETIGAGASMVYQAMFDEIDEGTAIFKCTNDPPVGQSNFADYEGLPSDHYLKLVGTATKMLRKEIPYTNTIPDMP
jgi:hypothetical protein